MIQKIQTLQKRLISKTEEVVEKVTRSGFLSVLCRSCISGDINVGDQQQRHYGGQQCFPPPFF